MVTKQLALVEKLQRLQPDALVRLLDIEESKRLSAFMRLAWPFLDGNPYVDGWMADAIAEHLAAVTYAEIRKLLITIPPRHGKTTRLLGWQCWVWSLKTVKDNPLIGPAATFLCASYSASKAKEDGLSARRLVGSEWYQSRWGHQVQITPDRDNSERWDTTMGGHRINVGVPESLGKGGTYRIIDDAHKTDQVESDVERSKVVRNYTETWATRSNSPQQGAEVVVGQRQAHNDLYNFILDQGGWTHLSLPELFDPKRFFMNSWGFADPRGLDDDTGEMLEGDDLEARADELLWPERFDMAWVREQEHLVGSHAFAAQYQQIPSARGAQIIRADQWRLWERPIFPTCDLVVTSLDGASTESDRKENAYSAMTIFGRFWLPDIKMPQFILLWAWRSRVELSDLVDATTRACMGDWRSEGQIVRGAVPDGGIRSDVLLIENKASGIQVVQEMRRLHGRRKWRTLAINPKGDKIARLKAVQPTFAGLRRQDGTYAPGQVWAPDKDWAQMVIDEVSQFPGSTYKDLTDTVSQAVGWLRTAGAVRTEEEAEADHVEKNKYRKPRRKLYPA